MGEKKSYKPWLRYTDNGGQGNASYLYSPFLERSVLFFSLVERNAYYVAERAGVSDFKEQFPMDPEETIEIASDLGIPHPVYRNTGIPVVLTLDALTSPRTGRPQILDSKWSTHFTRERVRQLRAIRDVYAARRSWPVLDLTEADFSEILVQNLQWIRECHEQVGKMPLTPAQLRKRAAQVLDSLGNDLQKRRYEPVHHFLRRQDARFEFSGVAVFALRRLLWRGLVDFAVDSIPFRSLLRKELNQLSLHRPD